METTIDLISVQNSLELVVGNNNSLTATVLENNLIITPLSGNTINMYGGVNSSYTHSQGIPSDTRTVHHNLGYYPQVSVYDSANDLIMGRENPHIDVNNMIIRFSAAFSGTAYLS